MSRSGSSALSRSVFRHGVRVAMLAMAVLAMQALPAGKVRALNLEEMTARAETIFSGHCVLSRSERDPVLGRTVTTYTFAVDRPVKGEVNPVFSYRQVGHPHDPMQLRGAIAGLPRFEVGEEVVLFLYGESELGLRSPVGFGQGKFSIKVDKQGRPSAINQFANVRLFDRLSQDAADRLRSVSGGELEDARTAPVTLLDMAEELTRLQREKSR